ncbi:MAG: hypothetical protein LBV26_07640 [Bacteroidales bacterium]|nr:hypothetical protein [Bacteroidales bacterium]
MELTIFYIEFNIFHIEYSIFHIELTIFHVAETSGRMIFGFILFHIYYSC